MTTDVETFSAPLNIGGIISDAFSITLKRFVLFVGLAIVVGVAFQLLSYAIFAEAALNPETLFLTASGWFIWLGMIVVPLVGYALLTALVTYAAYDTKLGRSVRLGTYIKVAMTKAPILIAVSVLSYIAIMIGVALLIVPGLMLMVMWAVILPVLIIEGLGFGSFSRSAALTKGYRWQILGLYIIMIVISLVISGVLGAALGFGLTAAFEGAGTIAALVFQGVAGSIGNVFGSVLIVVLYARLVEIKEGVGMGDLADIFD